MRHPLTPRGSPVRWYEGRGPVGAAVCSRRGAVAATSSRLAVWSLSCIQLQLTRGALDRGCGWVTENAALELLPPSAAAYRLVVHRGRAGADHDRAIDAMRGATILRDTAASWIGVRVRVSRFADCPIDTPEAGRSCVLRAGVDSSSTLPLGLASRVADGFPIDRWPGPYV